MHWLLLIIQPVLDDVRNCLGTILLILLNLLKHLLLLTNTIVWVCSLILSPELGLLLQTLCCRLILAALELQVELAALAIEIRLLLTLPGQQLEHRGLGLSRCIFDAEDAWLVLFVRGGRYCRSGPVRVVIGSSACGSYCLTITLLVMKFIGKATDADIA